MNPTSNAPRLLDRWGAPCVPRQKTTSAERVAQFEKKKEEVKRQFRRWGNFLTSPPAGKAVVSDSQIEKALQHQNIRGGTVYIPFVRDLYNLASGGSLNSLSTWDALVEPSLHRYAREMWQRKIPSHELSRYEPKHAKLLKKTSDFYRGLNFTKIPGQTALEKAISVIIAMQQKKTSEMWGHRGSSGTSSEDITATSGQGSKEAEQVMAVFEDVSTLSPEEIELLLADKAPSNGASKGTHFDEVLLQRQAAEELLLNPVKQQIFKIARTLEEYSEMQSHIPLEFERNPNGEDVQRRQMESFNELSKVDKSNWAIFQQSPVLFWQKVLSREMMVRERIQRNKKKQLLYMLIDVSGSMDDPKRIGTACGILMNRLKAVIAGDAELYYRFFDGNVYEEYHVKTKQQAHEAMRRVLRKNFSGGSTSIDNALRAGIRAVNLKLRDGSLVKPHIVVVSDGCDSISVTKEELADSVLHAFLCGGTNDTLIHLAKRSKGVGVVISN